MIVECVWNWSLPISCFKVWSIVWKPQTVSETARKGGLTQRFRDQKLGCYSKPNYMSLLVGGKIVGCWKNMWKGWKALKLKGRRELHAFVNLKTVTFEALEISDNLSAPPVQKCLLYLGIIQKRGWNKGRPWQFSFEMQHSAKLR